MADTNTERAKDRGDEPRGLGVDLDADLHRVDTDAYYEDETYRPEPLFQYGTLDTSDTGGASHQDMREISPAFDLARAENLRTAARALDPDDPTPEELVTLPQGAVSVMGTTKTPDEARDDLARSYGRLVDEPIVLGGVSPQARVAGEEDEEVLKGRKDNDSGSRRGSGNRDKDSDRDKDGDKVPDNQQGGTTTGSTSSTRGTTSTSRTSGAGGRGTSSTK